MCHDFVSVDNAMKFLLILACLFGIVGLAMAQEILGNALKGRTVFLQNCAVCHGEDAKGTGVLADTLPKKPANLTNCRLTGEDPVEIIEGTIRHGGAYVGLSPVMPAWEGKLSDNQIADVAAYVKTLCTDPDWLPGDLNFPRPLITGKAFPEQEVIIGGRFGRNSRDVTEIFGALEYRLDGLTNLEVRVPGLFTRSDFGSTKAGLGDVAVSVRRVVAYSIEHRALASLGLELSAPTGDQGRGLGSGEFVWEAFLRAGWDWRQFVTQAVVKVTLPQDSISNNAAFGFDMAFGRYFQPDPRMFITPMIEFNSGSRLAGSFKGETKSAVLPEVRFQWLRWSMGFGVQLPVSRHRDFEYRPLFDVVYEVVF